MGVHLLFAAVLTAQLGQFCSRFVLQNRFSCTHKNRVQQMYYRDVFGDFRTRFGSNNLPRLSASLGSVVFTFEIAFRSGANYYFESAAVVAMSTFCFTGVSKGGGLLFNLNNRYRSRSF